MKGFYNRVYSLKFEILYIYTRELDELLSLIINLKALSLIVIVIDVRSIDTVSLELIVKYLKGLESLSLTRFITSKVKLKRLFYSFRALLKEIKL